MKTDWSKTWILFLAQLNLLTHVVFHAALLVSIAHAISLASAFFMFRVPFEPVDLPALWCGLFSMLLIMHLDIVRARRQVEGMADACVTGLVKLGELLK